MKKNINIRYNLHALHHAFNRTILQKRQERIIVPDYLSPKASFSVFQSELHRIHLQLFSMSTTTLKAINDTVFEKLYLLYEPELEVDTTDLKWQSQCRFTTYVMNRFLSAELGQRGIAVPEYRGDVPLEPSYLEYAFFCRLLIDHPGELLQEILKESAPCFLLPITLLEDGRQINEETVRDFFVYSKIYNPVLLLIDLLKTRKFAIQAIYYVLYSRILEELSKNLHLFDHTSANILYRLMHHCKNQIYNEQIEACFDMMRKISFESRRKKIPSITGFKLNNFSLLELKKERIPEELLERLHDIKDKSFVRKEHFLSDLEHLIGREQTEQYQTLFLQYALMSVSDSLLVGMIGEKYPGILLKNREQVLLNVYSEAYFQRLFHQDYIQQENEHLAQEKISKHAKLFDFIFQLFGRA